jgi:hypothetical protein
MLPLAGMVVRGSGPNLQSEARGAQLVFACRIPVILMFCGHGPDRARHLVGERDSHLQGGDKAGHRTPGDVLSGAE